jgi:hypothetical protein
MRTVSAGAATNTQQQLPSTAVLAAIRALVTAAPDGVKHATYTEHNVHICYSQ